MSRLTHEFRVSVTVLEEFLAPYLSNGQLTVLPGHAPQSAEVSNDRLSAVTVRDLIHDRTRVITASYFLDATELGDLLPLAKAEFVTGAESQVQTGEMHAPDVPRPGNSQSFTFCLAVDYLSGEDHTIEKPAQYDRWRNYVPKLAPPWTGELFSWTAPAPRTLRTQRLKFIPNPTENLPQGITNLWVYRRVADRSNFEPAAYRSDITLINWPQNDFWLSDVVTCSLDQRKNLFREARQLSLSLLYWMQTQAPGPNDHPGWKGLRLRPDIVGTADGLAKAPYIRESRRIAAEFTVLEQHVGTEMRSKERRAVSDQVTSERFPDSVGVGCYRIDLHPSAGGTNYVDISSLPFQIPLGALIPKRLENLLAAAKNIGTTHITNGCYRLHPVEWNIGEAAGSLAAYAVRTGKSARAIRNNRELLRDFQSHLIRKGVELDWPPVHAV